MIEQRLRPLPWRSPLVTVSANLPIAAARQRARLAAWISSSTGKRATRHGRHEGHRPRDRGDLRRRGCLGRNLRARCRRGRRDASTALEARGVPAFGEALDVADGERYRAWIERAAERARRRRCVRSQRQRAGGRLGGGLVAGHVRDGPPPHGARLRRGHEARTSSAQRAARSSSSPRSRPTSSARAAGQAYGAIKAAMISAAGQLAAELGPLGIRGQHRLARADRLRGRLLGRDAPERPRALRGCARAGRAEAPRHAGGGRAQPSSFSRQPGRELHRRARTSRSTAARCRASPTSPGRRPAARAPRRAARWACRTRSG